MLPAEILAHQDPRARFYITPTRIVWARGGIRNTHVLLEDTGEQATLDMQTGCTMDPGASLLLDFGREIHGSVMVTAGGMDEHTAPIRIRLGESAMEAMSELGEKNSTNDHALRDGTIKATWLGTTEFGPSGFRFARIDIPQDGMAIRFSAVKAILLLKPLAYKGSFRCSDPLLNRVWETGAYTVHLNMQRYIWDGIKRDRLVWVGDMHPETVTLRAVFGYDESVPMSLDLIREESPLPKWMNGTPSYSMTWLIIQSDWFLHHGDMPYLQQQEPYLLGLIHQINASIGPDGAFLLNNYFIDWPSSTQKDGERVGLLALAAMAMEAGTLLCRALGREDGVTASQDALQKLRRAPLTPVNNKQAMALAVDAGLLDAATVNKESLAPRGAHGLSTFRGYHVLRARAKANDMAGALQTIREYWGGMLQMGATSFWEDFDIDWMQNAAPIDELTPPGKRDIHGDCGAFCYEGYRHSLCHGWASGPTAFLSESVLGISIAEPGAGKVTIRPVLGDLLWAEGTYPLPQGNVHVRAEKQADGSVKVECKLPPGVERAEA